MERARLLGAAAALAGMMSTPSFLGVTDGPQEQPIATSAAASVLQADVSEIAKAFNISNAEAIRQLELQDAMDSLPFSSLDPGYAEDGSEMGSPFTIWYRSASEPSADLLRAMEEAGVLEYVRFERVPLSLADLTKAAKLLQAKMRRAGIKTGLTIDTSTGGVRYRSPGRLRLNDRTRMKRLAKTSGLPITWGGPPPVSFAVRGGQALALGNCTAGFIVKTDSNNKRVFDGWALRRRGRDLKLWKLGRWVAGQEEVLG